MAANFDCKGFGPETLAVAIGAGAIYEVFFELLTVGVRLSFLIVAFELLNDTFKAAVVACTFAVAGFGGDINILLAAMEQGVALLVGEVLPAIANVEAKLIGSPSQKRQIVGVLFFGPGRNRRIDWQAGVGHNQIGIKGGQ